MNNEKKVDNKASESTSASSQTLLASKQKTNSAKGGKRVIILNDTSTHIGPTLARNFAKLNHNIVLGTPAEGLADEVRKLGAEVVVVDDLPDLSEPEAVKRDRRSSTFCHVIT